VIISSTYRRQWCFLSCGRKSHLSFPLAASDLGENPISYVDGIALFILDFRRHDVVVVFVFSLEWFL
jgi:hypothetical protein